MIKSYWLRLLLFAVVGAGLGLVVSLLSPKKYEAIMQIMIDQNFGTPPPSISDAANNVADLTNFPRSRSVSTQVEELTSFGVIEIASQRAKEALRAPDNDEELSPENLQNAITVGAEATSDIISARVRCSTPERAKIVAQEIYKAYDEKHTENSADNGQRAIEKIAAMHDKLKNRLEVIDVQMEALRNKGAVDPTSQVSATVNSIEKLKDQRDAIQISYAGALQKARTIGLELAKAQRTPRMKTSESISANPNIVGLESQIVLAETQRDVALKRYTEDHPTIIDMDIQLASLKNQLAKLKRVSKKIDNTQVSEANPLVQQLLAAQAGANTDLSSYADQLREANAALAARTAEEKQWPRWENELQKLLREQVALERKYTDATAELETLRARQQGRTSPSQLITAPTPLPDPVSPKHFINLMFGCIGGLILGVLSMLSTEGKRQPIRSLAHLNSLATQSVYRIIPELRMPFRGLNKAPAEPYETLLVNFRRSEKRPYRLGIVGITKDAGASITSLNVALAAEKHGARALIVETDERSTIRRLLQRQGVGVEGQVSHVTPYVTLYTVDALRQTQNEDGTAGFSSDIRNMEADLSVFDFEPATESAEYAFAASHLDEMIVLVRAERTKSVEFLHAQQALAESGCRVITVVFARSSDLQLVTDAIETYEPPKALSQ